MSKGIVDFVLSLEEDIMSDSEPRLCWLCEDKNKPLEEPFNICDDCMNRKDLWDMAIYTVSD